MNEWCFEEKSEYIRAKSSYSMSIDPMVRLLSLFLVLRTSWTICGANDVCRRINVHEEGRDRSKGGSKQKSDLAADKTSHERFQRFLSMCSEMR